MNTLERLQPRFANKLSLGSKGGLVVFGLNWGGTDNDGGSGWLEVFSRPPKKGDYPFRWKLVRWLQCWGVTFSDPANGTLRDEDRFVSQTNLQSDTSRTYAAGEQWSAAKSARHMLDVVQSLQPSGILISSIPKAMALFGSPGHLPDELKVEWQNEFRPSAWKPRIKSTSGRLSIQLASPSASGCEIAAVTHPSARGISNEAPNCPDVVAEMKPLMARVLSRYQEFQRAGLTHPNSPPRARASG
jgi:hypothetical protein